VLGLTGYLRRDPMALLPGRANPYPVHARLRKNGPLTLTRPGDWVTISHRVCDAVLRDRRFGIRMESAPDMSMFSMNPPEHTRLRRLAIPAFSPKVVAGYQPRIERTVSDLLDRASAAGQFDMVADFLLLIAAFETTQNLIGNGVLALLNHPEQWELLCADSCGLAARTVEEVLRRDTPIQRADRYALSDLELEGKAVRKGQRMIALIGAANRDPEVYSDPDRFDIMRESTAGH